MSWLAEVMVNGRAILMELDTGAEISTMPKHVFDDKFGGESLRKSNKKLCQYDGAALKLVGEMQVEAEYKGQRFSDAILVVDVKSRYPLLGRDWMSKVRLDWNEIFYGSQKLPQRYVNIHEVSCDLQNKY